jgi:hypothetical protein
MEKIRVNLVIEQNADAELFNYLVNMPARRRATLIRTLATQGMNGEGHLKAVSTKGVTAREIFSDYPKPSAKESELIPATELLPNTNDKEKALGNALGDLTF